MLHCTPFTAKNVTEDVTQVPFAEVRGHEPSLAVAWLRDRSYILVSESDAMEGVYRERKLIPLAQPFI